MTKTICAAILLAAGAAHAGGQANSIGVGAEAQLNGIGGVSVVYDGGKFHAGAMFGYRRDDIGGGMTESETDFGAGFYFHVHQTGTSDFGVGANLGVASVPVMGMMGNTSRVTDVFFEPGFQIRVFIVGNVALSFMGGVSIGFSDATRTSIGAEGLGISTSTRDRVGLEGGAGIHYYFF